SPACVISLRAKSRPATSSSLSARRVQPGLEESVRAASSPRSVAKRSRTGEMMLIIEPFDVWSTGDSAGFGSRLRLYSPAGRCEPGAALSQPAREPRVDRLGVGVYAVQLHRRAQILVLGHDRIEGGHARGVPDV